MQRTRRARSSPPRCAAALFAVVLAGCGTSNDAPEAGGTAGTLGRSGASSAGAPSGGSAGSTALSQGGMPSGASGSASGGIPSSSGASGSSEGGRSGSPAGVAGKNSGGTNAASAGASGSGTTSSGTSDKGGSGNSGGTGGSAGASGSSTTGSGRLRHIMPLGDSITGTTCYPQLLSKMLKDAGKTNFDFIGTNLNNQNCNGAPNVQTEGHGGYLVTYLVDDDPKPMGNKGSLRELNQWLANPPAPDVLLLLHGTNDVWNSISPDEITSAYSFVLGKVREKNPSVIVFTGKLLPMHPNGCVDSTSSCENNRVKALNAVIPAWASGASTPTSPVHVVDVYGSVNADEFKPNSSLTSDGVHPNVTASTSIAKAWYDALTENGIP